MQFEEMIENDTREINGGISVPVNPLSPVIPIIVGKIVNWLLNR